MNEKQLAIFKDKLTQACELHLQNGGTIDSGTFLGLNNRCCPLGCMLKETSFDYDHNIGYFTYLNEALQMEISQAEYWAFIEGVDAVDNMHGYPETFKLGCYFRLKYITNR